MDSFELNKIMGAVLGTLVFVMGLGFLAEAIYHPIENRGVGYALPEPEEGATQTAEAEPEATPLPVLLASASADAGASVARRCQSCHTFEEGGADMTGPHLYGVVGRQIAGASGFGYSNALQTYGEENGAWTYALLDAFIHDPQGEVDGTSMSFAGLDDEEDRADLLAYLQTLSADPVPFPEPEAEAPAGNEAAADEGDAATEGEGEAASEDQAPEDSASQDEAAASQGDEASEDEAAASEQAPSEDAAAASASQSEPAQEEAPAGGEASGDDAATGTDESASGDEAGQDDEATAPDDAASGEEASGDATENDDAAASGGEASELETMIANASADEGARLMRQCQACHDWAEDGVNKVGPVLWDVVGSPIASVEDYSYSDALIAYGEENGDWSYALLDAFLADPMGEVEGTKMGFGGIGDAEERAAIIAFLRQQAPEPAPLAGE